MSDQARRRDRVPVVRPRTVWTGVAVCVLGMGVVAAGMMSATSLATGAGVLVVGVGLAVAWRGGILHDVHTSAEVRQEVDQVRLDLSRPGISPEGRVTSTPSRKRETEAADARRERSKDLSRMHDAPTRGVAPTLLIVLAAWVFVSDFVLAYPFSELGQDAALRNSLFAVVLALSGLYLRQVGPSRLATDLCLLAGGGLVLSGALLEHTTTRSAGNELVTGALVLLVAALSRHRPL